MEDDDIVVERLPGGRFTIRRWQEDDGILAPIANHEDTYEEGDMCRRLNKLRPYGNIYLRDGFALRLIQS